MCGFLGVFQQRSIIDETDFENALNSIAHRGPDAEGVWREGGVALGHRRLSIIDLETGDQPMHSSDHRYVLVFNGEIYNFRELRQILEQEGMVFTTHSDSEVVLQAYRRWGSDVVNRLNGMFSFVIWDRAERTVFGARDRLGIKPFCWGLHQGALVVSSTLEPFHSLRDFKEFNPVAVRDLMSFDYISAPRTILKSVQKLEPGNTFMWQMGSLDPVIERYWAPPLEDAGLQAPDEFELEQLIESAVERQMVGDVPIGVFLSGGIDSSLLVAMMARHSEKPIRSFSIAFDEVGVDESPIADLVARQFGTDHSVLRAEKLGPEELLELIGRLDEPFADPAIVPTYALSKMTASHVKVALSGDGADEVFGGYPKYLAGSTSRGSLPLSSLVHRTLQALPWRPRGMAHLYWRFLSSQDQIPWSWARYGDFPIFRKDLRQLLASAYHDEADIANFFESWERRARTYGQQYGMDVLMRTDLETYLSENCLVKTDRASMLASLEVRVPFLDETVLDRILPLSVGKKIHKNTLKALLMPIASRLLPREVWDRPKHGFNVPLDVWLRGSWKPAVELALEWGEHNIDLFNYDYLRHLHRINISDGGIGRELWNPFVFLAWAMGHSRTS